MEDTVTGGDKGADVIKFEWMGDFQYIVYVSLFKHANYTKDVSLAES